MSNTELAPHQQRVVAEKAELDVRISKLRTFLMSETYLTLGQMEQQRLDEQLRHMAGYSDVLDRRIGAFK